jgi:hypothetical protein
VSNLCLVNDYTVRDRYVKDITHVCRHRLGRCPTVPPTRTPSLKLVRNGSWTQAYTANRGLCFDLNRISKQGIWKSRHLRQETRYALLLWQGIIIGVQIGDIRGVFALIVR